MPTSQPRSALPIKPFTPALLLATAIFPLSMGVASAASFTITSNSTTAQTLGSASGQSGTIAAGKALTVSGGTVAVTISGNNATLTNLGTISQTGSGRAVRDNTGVTGLVINNGSATNGTAVMQTADADVVQMNRAGASVTLNNYGALISNNASAGGSQAVDFNAITSGANVVNNYAGGLIVASEADAVRPGVNGVINNAGTIRSLTSTGGSSDGIDGQNNSGIVILNDAGGLVDGARHGITGGQLDSSTPFAMSVTNNAGATIRGNNGSGINIDGLNGLELVTVVNHGTITGNGVTGDGDGVDVDGLVNLSNTGTIRSINAYSAAGSGLAYSEGLSVGGGTIVNSGTIEGSVAAGNTNAVGRGITLVGNDISSGALAGTREGIYGNSVVTNLTGGLIQGDTDSAIVAQGAASGYTISIVNNAGATIRGGGTSSAALLVAKDSTTITNAGLIDGSSSGKAIELGSGNNQITISGGSAFVLGSINGGVGGSNSLTVTPGAGNSFTYTGALSNFSSVAFTSGSTTLSGVSTYTGTTQVSNATLTLVGVNRLAAGSALQLDNGTLRLTNAAGVTGQSFASLSLSGNSAIDLGYSSITFNGLGNVATGATLAVTEAAGAYVFRLLGDYSGDANFLALISGLQIDGVAAAFHYDGTYTSISAVPEPATYALLLAGLALVTAMARRRRSAAKFAAPVTQHTAQLGN